jgi:cytochrome b involved in lipid metabolism
MMFSRSAARAAPRLLLRYSTRSLATQAARLDQRNWFPVAAAAAALMGVATATYTVSEQAPKHGKLDNQPPPRPDLPTFSLDDVSEHCEEESLWYTFRGGVYDLTFFINGHPGGTPRLLMAAGQDLEPYWEVYRQHFRGHIVDWMEEVRKRASGSTSTSRRQNTHITFHSIALGT